MVQATQIPTTIWTTFPPKPIMSPMNTLSFSMHAATFKQYIATYSFCCVLELPASQEHCRHRLSPCMHADTDFISLYASATDAGPKPVALVKESSAVSYLRTRALNIKQDNLVPIFAGDSTVKLSFQECEFENNTLPLRIQVVPGGEVYSDNRTELVWQDGGDSGPLEPMDALPLSEAESSGAFLSVSDPEYMALRDVRFAPCHVSPCSFSAAGTYHAYMRPGSVTSRMRNCCELLCVRWVHAGYATGVERGR